MFGMCWVGGVCCWGRSVVGVVWCLGASDVCGWIGGAALVRAGCSCGYASSGRPSGGLCAGDLWQPSLLCGVLQGVPCRLGALWLGGLVWGWWRWTVVGAFGVSFVWPPLVVVVVHGHCGVRGGRAGLLWLGE